MYRFVFIVCEVHLNKATKKNERRIKRKSNVYNFLYRQLLNTKGEIRVTSSRASKREKKNIRVFFVGFRVETKAHRNRFSHKARNTVRVCVYFGLQLHTLFKKKAFFGLSLFYFIAPLHDLNAFSLNLRFNVFALNKTL